MRKNIIAVILILLMSLNCSSVFASNSDSYQFAFNKKNGGLIIAAHDNTKAIVLKGFIKDGRVTLEARQGDIERLLSFFSARKDINKIMSSPRKENQYMVPFRTTLEDLGLKISLENLDDDEITGEIHR